MTNDTSGMRVCNDIVAMSKKDQSDASMKFTIGLGNCDERDMQVFFEAINGLYQSSCGNTLEFDIVSDPCKSDQLSVTATVFQ